MREERGEGREEGGRGERKGGDVRSQRSERMNERLDES